MSTSKHINKICMSVIAVTVALTILFMCGAPGITASASKMKYESTLFDTSYVHQIDIVMDDWDSFIESCESEEYSVCTLAIDGVKYSNIAIRAKGNTSLSNVKSLGSQRYSFKLEFDHYDEGKTVDGLDKLCLNNLIQDNTMMKDYIVYRMMNDFGVDTPLCSYAYLTVNGEDWGLYLAVESVEDSFLSRNYGSDIGDLYKPDSTSFGGGRGNGKDFNMDEFTANQSNNDTSESPDNSESTQQGGMTSPGMGGGMQGGGGFSGGNMPDMSSSDSSQMPDMGSFPGGDVSDMGDLSFDDMPDMGDFSIEDAVGGSFGSSDDVKLKYIDDDPDSYSNIFDNAKTDASSADKTRLIQALENLTNYTDLENTLDMDEVLRYFVVHNFVCNGDSYTGSMIHNYYLYEDDGQLSMIPWDYNLAFGTFQGGNASSTVNSDIDNPVSGDVDDRPMVGWIFSDESYTEAYHELFSEFIEKWFTNGELEALITETADMIRPYVEKDPTKFCTSEEFESGVAAIKEFVTLRAEAVSNQLDGDYTAVDTGSLNLSDMGTMGNTIGGADAMPDMLGADSDASMPDMSEMPEMPNGSSESEMPEMPNGSSEGEMPEMSDNMFDGGSGQMPSQGGETDEAFDPSDFSGNENTDFAEMNPFEEQTSSSSTWILLGVSIAVLIAGLFIVIKKK